jgi:asparagine synthase (glutamine-hydrolysing)
MNNFKHYQHLGFNNPYYIANKVPFVIRKKFSEIIDVFDDELRIDPTSVIELLNKNYIFGDRTMIKGIYRTPWQAKPNDSYTQWQYTHPPRHDKKSIPEEEIALLLFEKICNEIEGYISNKKNVGVLLSGGMDSRMVAGAIDYLTKSGRLKNINVTGLTWGNENSRDVVYAKEIATRLGWKWKHYVVGAEQLKNNIYETAMYGCEYSPIHLHAIPQIRDDNDLDVILAGSYGDSVGRAEYSGIKVKDLPPLDKSIKNVSGLINNGVYNSSLKEIKEDIKRYQQLFPANESYMQYEMDYELHYMRRMLNPCMELLTEKSEFYQVFTHPDVFGFMWSIDPEKRNDMVYKHMMKAFKTDLSDIPWARTGLPYMANNGIPDIYSKKHHSYVEIINRELLQELKLLIFSGRLDKLNIFDMENIAVLLKLISKHPINNLYYGERIMWLASLSLFLENYKFSLIKMNEKYISKHSNISNRITLLASFLKRKAKTTTKKILKMS